MRHFLLFCFPFLLSVSLLQADFREFRNQYGQRFRAEIISVDGDQVTLRLSGGRSAQNMSIDSLSSRDQDYVREWEEARQIGENLALSISEERASLPLPDSPYRQGQYEKINFSIQIHNQGSQTLRSISIRYRIHYEEAHPQANDQHTPRVIEDQIDISELAVNRRETLTTQDFFLRQFEIPGQTTLHGSNDRRLEDRIQGLEISVYRGDFRTDRQYYPEDLEERLNR